MEAGNQPGLPTWNQSQNLEQLEREGRFAELANELAGIAARTEGAERAAVLARLGEVRLRLDDISRAVSAFSESLEIEPTQATSRRWLEVLLAEPEHALAAAEALEPVFEAEFRTIPHSASMLLAILELKANRSDDQDERIAIWVHVGALFDHAALPPERAREIAARLLSRTASEWPGGVGKWIERVTRLSTDPAQRIDALLTALNQPLSDPLTISELGLAAGHELQSLGRNEEARPLYERALSADPTSPEALSRTDAMAEAAGESGEQRAERYRVALERADDPERKAALRVAFGLLQKNVLDDLESAAVTLRAAIAEKPALFRAHEALLEVLGALQDERALEQELERALSVFEGGEWRLTLARLGETLLARGRASEALARTKPLLDELEVDEGTLELLERLAEEVSDLETSRRVHERRMELAPEGFARAQALESLGEFMNERLHDAAAAAATWKRAAELLAQNADENSEPERLYERVLQVTPGDVEAAQRLVELCARGADWTKVPAACRALLDASKDPLAVVPVVLSLETRAAQTGGADEFAAIVDEVASRLDDAQDAETRALVAAKARVMTACARFDEAATVYEALIESYADEQDVRAYVGLVESSPDSEWRHKKRSWLFEWRAQGSEDPVAVLTHWATVEEQEFSDIPAAIALLERATKTDAKRPEVWRELSRLRIASGDTAAGLTALTRLRELGGEGDASTVELTMAELMIERLDEPADALPLLESVLKAHPDHPRARELILVLTKNPMTSLRAAELFERASSSADTPDMQREVLTMLLDSTEQASRDGSGGKELAALRRRWFERLVGLESGERALSVFERAAAEFATDETIWQAVEAGAVRQNTPEAALRAYEGALERTEDPELAEALGKRLVAFASEHVGNPRALTAPLERLLKVAPTARWAFDRIKLSLTSEQRWEALFGAYERVLDALSDVSERARLLDEAAVAARDFASDPDRAIGYWESYFALRADDARVDLALERLYERQQKLEKLIEHLSRREPNLEGDELIRSRERIAGLWIELKNAKSALAVVESLPKSAALNESTLALLEAVFKLEVPEGDADARKVSRRAARLLKQRYTSLERPAAVAQVLVSELTGITEQKERVKLLTQLAELRQTLAEEGEEFDTLGELVLLEPETEAHRVRLAELGAKLDRRGRLGELIVLAAERVGDGPLFAELLAEAAGIFLDLSERDRAITLFFRILDEAKADEARVSAARRLQKLLLEAARPLERCTVLERLAGLANDPKEKREALLEAARVALDELSDPSRAAADYRLLLETEPNDRSLLDGLLLALRAGQRWQEVIEALARRAALDPRSAAARRDLGDAAKIRAEQLGDAESAIDAWRAVRASFGRDAESFEQLSGLLESSGRYPELAELLADEASASSAPAPLYARLAEVHRKHTGDLPSALIASVRAGDLVGAAELFSGHAELVPDDPSLALELAKKLSAAGSVAIAERVLYRQIEHYGPRRPKEGTRVHLALAELLVATAREPLALRELSAAAERYPESGAILAALGSLSMQLGDLERAEQSYRGLLLLLGRPSEEGEVRLGRAHVYLYLSEVAALRGDGQKQQDHVASAFESGLGSEEDALALEDALRAHQRPDLVERAVTSRLERARDPAKVAVALRDLLELTPSSGPVEAGTAERALRLAERAARDLEGAGGAQTHAWHALLDVFVRLDEKEKVLKVLEALAQRSATDAEHAEYDLLIAHRLLALPDRRDDAIDRLWQLVRKDAANSEPYEMLTELLPEGAAYEPLLELLRAQLDAAEAAADSERAQTLALRLALAFERANRLREALDVYARLGKHEARRREALEKVVELHERLGTQGGELADALEALLEIESDSERAAALALRLADLRRHDWDEEGVERALEKGFAIAPLRLDLADALAKRLLERGAHGHAIEVLERAIEHQPSNPDLRVRLADAFNRSGNPERALSALDAALSAHAPEAAVRRERARILEAVGRADEALAELDVALHAEGGSSEELLAAIERTRAFETSERWALRAADLCAEAGQRSRARSLLEPWAERNGESVQVLSRIGRLANMDRDFPTALAAYKKVCALEHGNAKRTAVLAYARVAESAGRAEEAIPEVEAVIAEGLDSVELRRELGKLYARTGDRLKQGRMLLEEARAAKPAQQIELFGKAAELLAANGASDEALAALTELRKLDPERIDVVLLTASTLGASGRNEEGREILTALLANTERKRSKAHAKVYQRLAELMLAEDELLEALEALNQAHQLDKNDAEIALLLGLLAADLDQSETAFNALRAYVSLKEKSIDLASRRQLSRAYLQLGELELVKGQRTVARRMLTRAVETDPENKNAHRFLAELGPR